MKKVKETHHDYDFLCIGTSSLMALEAIFLAKNGAKVIMIDKDEAFGGAWKTIEMGGIKDVENAIHYFLPNKKALEFMRKEMKWPVEKCSSKYRYFELTQNFYFRLPYDSLVGRITKEIFSPTKKISIMYIKNLLKILVSSKNTSFYLSSGAAGMLLDLQHLLRQFGVVIKNNSAVTDIFFDKDSVKCKVNNLEISAGKLVIGHGARLPVLRSLEKNLQIKEKFYPRPAYHLIIKDNKRTKALEAVLQSDPVIKYIHDVTRFTTLSNVNEEGWKIFVFALQGHVTNYEGLAQKLKEKLRAISLISSSATIIDSRYTEVFLPTLHDSDLQLIKQTFGDQAHVVKTENFSVGVENIAKKW